MKQRRKRDRQGGVALMVALFALMLLSAIGMAMMYSADMETSINANYRDKQAAIYAALAGVQEARDRLAPTGGDILFPKAMPTLSNGYVFYIINPNGDTVAPWSSTSTSYPDSELCQERNLADASTLNLTLGTNGVRCSGAGALPTGNTWYTKYDHTDASYTGPYKLSNPLAYKWVRITLKANNSTAVPANGSTASATQLCWDGRNQIPIPAGYNTLCSPGTVGSVTITNGGTGYSPTPTVTFSGGGGSGATATATVTVGSLSSLNLTNGGNNYTSIPTVTIAASPAGGNTATATAQITGKVTAATWPNAGQGKGCPANTTLNLIFSGGGGTGAAGTVATDHNGTLSGNSATITNQGTGYNSPPVVAVDATCTTYPTITATITGTVTGLQLTYTGSGYVAAPTVTISGGGGTGATATSTISPPTISAINVTNGGLNYTSAPTVTITDPTGTGAVATAHLTGGSYLGTVMLLTSLAVTPTGARAMVQMEVAPTVRGLTLPGALTLAGPAGPVSLPVYSGPSSSGFQISGQDANSCGGTAANHPSIGAYDNPNSPTSPTAVAQTLAGIPSGRTGNYPGIQTSPDVENVYGSLGDQLSTPQGLWNLLQTIAGIATNTYTGPITDAQLAPGTPTKPVVDYVNGDLTIAGNYTGYGILVVTGTLHLKGNFSWNGLMFVVGQGDTEMSGGGGVTINGSMLVAKIFDSSGNLLSSLASPVVNWGGGGGNGIFYDHCIVNAMMGMIPFTPPPDVNPLTVLSTRTLSY